MLEIYTNEVYVSDIFIFKYTHIEEGPNGEYKRRPDIYHEINWKVNHEKNLPRIQISKSESMYMCGSIRLKTDYEVCMETAFPRVKVGIFEKSMASLQFTGFEIEDPPKGTGGYQRPCEGDSGSAHWITNYQMKAVIVAIMSKGDEPCGTTEPRTVPHSGAVLHITTSPKIHQWIKWRAGIN